MKYATACLRAIRIPGWRIVILVVGLTAVGCGSRPDQRTVLLTPQSSASKVAIHYEIDDEFYCSFDPRGLGPRIPPVTPLTPTSPIVVGREFSADYGTQPLPCGSALVHDYIAALNFNLSDVIRDGGVVERAVLRFRRSATDQPIHLPDRAAGACKLFVLAPSSDWDDGYHVGDEGDPAANPPAALLFAGTPRAEVHFRNSADPADATQELDVTPFVASTILRGGRNYHGLLLSPRRDPASRARVLLGWGEGWLGARLTEASCTGLLSDFQLEVSLVRLVRDTP